MVILSPVTILPLILKLARCAHLGFGDRFGALTPALVGSCTMLVPIGGVREFHAGKRLHPLAYATLRGRGRLRIRTDGPIPR